MRPQRHQLRRAFEAILPTPELAPGRGDVQKPPPLSESLYALSFFAAFAIFVSVSLGHEVPLAFTAYILPEYLQFES